MVRCMVVEMVQCHVSSRLTQSSLTSRDIELTIPRFLARTSSCSGIFEKIVVENAATSKGLRAREASL